MAVVRNVDSDSTVSILGESWALFYRALRCCVGPFSFPCLLVVRVRGRFVVPSFWLGTFPSMGSYGPGRDSTGTRSTLVPSALASGT